jgi:hypothetical protein
VRRQLPLRESGVEVGTQTFTVVEGGGGAVIESRSVREGE